MFNPNANFNWKQPPSTLVDRAFGKSYHIVKAVYEKLDALIDINNNPNINFLVEHWDTLTVVADLHQQIYDIATNLDEILKSSEYAAIAKESAELAKTINEDSKNILITNTEIKNYFSKLEPSFKVVVENADNITDIVKELESIIIVAADLRGGLLKDMARDLGMVGDESESDHTGILGGNIKNVADNIDSVNKVNNNLDEVINVSNIIDDIPQIKKGLAQFKKEVVAEADRAEQEANISESWANFSKEAKEASIVAQKKSETAQKKSEEARDLAKDWAIKLNETVDGKEFSSKYYALEAKDRYQDVLNKATEINNKGDALIEAIEAEGNNQINTLIATGNVQNNRLVSTGNTQNTKINNTAKTQLDAITTEGTNQVKSVTSTGNTKIQEITDLTTEKITEVNTLINTAKLHADSAEASATVAKENASTSTDKANIVSTKATEALTSATNASTYANNASTSASTATTQANNAKASATTATNQANLAKNWAIKLDGTVDDSEYSSKYYAQEAKKQADNSSSTYANITNTVNTAISTINSKLDETTSQANIAKENATIATTQATEATTQATNASASANTATAKATLATEQATLATTKAEEASSYANDAKDEALRAKDYASQASQNQINSDWNETNPNEKSYIKNKPDIYTKAEVDTKLTAVYKYKGSVDTKSDLPKSGMEVGWTYNVKSNGANYSWDGATWDELGATIDLSPYATKNEVSSTYLPLRGGTLTGNLTVPKTFTLKAVEDTSNLLFLGGTNYDGGSGFYLYGKDQETYPGQFHLYAKDSDNSSLLRGVPSGILTWRGKNIVRSVNNTNADENGNVTIAMPDLTPYATSTEVTDKLSNYLPLSGGTLTGNLMFSSSTDNHALLCNVKDNGTFLETYEANSNTPKSRLVLRAYNHATRAGWFELDAEDSTNSKTLIGKPDGILTWDSKNIVRSINNINADTKGNVSLDLSTYATKNLVESTKTNILTEVSSNYLSSKESIDLGMIGE